MDELKVVRLDETEIVKFGPDAVYQMILGDDEGTTPIRTGIQTSQPGYVAPVHSHPYMEVLVTRTGRSRSERATPSPSRRSFRTASGSWGARCYASSAPTPRPRASSNTRTA